jgi:hypothetical protein
MPAFGTVEGVGCALTLMVDGSTVESMHVQKIKTKKDQSTPPLLVPVTDCGLGLGWHSRIAVV